MCIKRFKEIFYTGGWIVHVRRAFDSACYFEGKVEDIPSYLDEREVLQVMPFSIENGNVAFSDDWQLLDVGISD